jgi:predicted phage tail protein
MLLLTIKQKVKKMPKGRKIVKIDGRVKRFNIQRKFRIGTRKNGVSALGMTIEALKAVLEKADQKRYHSNARAVLAMRGVTA